MGRGDTTERGKGRLKRTKTVNPLKDTRVIKASSGNGIRIQSLSQDHT